jgi:endoglucanase
MIPSVSGRENAVREKITEIISPFVDECRTDNLGNLIALKKGAANDTKKKIMLCAHMDEIGFLVTHIDEKGFLRIAPVGGISFSASNASIVISERGVKGVLIADAGVKPADFSADKFVIDIGAKTKKEAERKVKIGDFFVVTPTLSRLCGKRVCGRPLDDRIGCAVILEVARNFANTTPAHDIYYVFSVQEEVGCRGAKTAAFGIAPDYALVYDVTGTGDSVGAKPMECELGGGAAIKIKDSSVICHTETVDMLRDISKRHSIPIRWRYSPMAEQTPLPYRCQARV